MGSSSVAERCQFQLNSNILFLRPVVSFVLQNGFAQYRNSRTKENIKNGKKKWIDDKVQDLIELLEEKPFFVGYFFEQVHKEGGERKNLDRIGGIF